MQKCCKIFMAELCGECGRN